ncbi:hypothetical protein B0T10DRAFT_460817 [Thelonectria olida]|uniref:Uncharacterized protein n=1 Tax=Thelonectria olida TaxID=1576542 RepID=A0A9P8W546_9HYPO|nr:hypothetical protein B0T10DRAFT_460817 [Thelonectria olida]
MLTSLLKPYSRPLTAHGSIVNSSLIPSSTSVPIVALSLGPSTPRDYINKKDQTLLKQYVYFLSYSTSFIMATKVELESRGDTTHLEEAIESSSFDANLKLGYGPFSLGASYKEDKSSARTKMETTATGTRITLEEAV